MLKTRRTALALLAVTATAYIVLAPHHDTWWLLCIAWVIWLAATFVWGFLAAAGRDLRAGWQLRRTQDVLAAQRSHVEAAATDEGWQQHINDDHNERPREVIINEVVYAVQPLTLPVLKQFMEAGEALMSVQVNQHPLAQMMGQVEPVTSSQMVAAYDGMYAQLAVLLVDPEGVNPSADTLGVYVPMERCAALLQLLGPGGGQ
jgi:hypothetical protein